MTIGALFLLAWLVVLPLSFLLVIFFSYQSVKKRSIADRLEKFRKKRMKKKMRREIIAELQQEEKGEE
jgi:cbb3-type cytochrome oxidase subunit 3